jgi:hypothetical protein
MAASRSMLEALLARVQQRASEPRTSVVVSARSAPQREELADEDVEDYDDELIEIIDDAEIIPEAAAAARAIDVGAVVSSLERRAAASRATQSTPPQKQAPASTRGAVTRPSAPTNGALRPESVSQRPPAATQVVQARGVRRELRTTSFVELLDAALKLGV